MMVFTRTYSLKGGAFPFSEFKPTRRTETPNSNPNQNSQTLFEISHFFFTLTQLQRREMEIQCRCGFAAVEQTSWTDLNPGRRYASCRRFRALNGCEFFIWLDPPVGDRERQIIPGLLRRVNRVPGEVREVNNNENEAGQIDIVEEELVRVKKREKWLWVVVFILILI